MKRALMVVAALVVLGLGSARASADPPATLYVDASWAGTALGADPDGSGPATSFGTDSFATIGDALAVATSGATIDVDAGTYVESNLQVTQPGVTLAGSGSDVTHVTLGSLEIDASNVVVQDLDIHGGGTWNSGTLTYTGPDDAVVKIDAGALGANIQRCVISDGAVGVLADGGGGADGAFVQNNEITRVVVGVEFDGTQDDTLQFNSIHDTGDVTGAAPQAGVVVAAPGGGNYVKDNTIVNSANDGVSIRSDGNHVLANDIENSGTGYPTFPEPTAIDVSLANGNTLSGNFIRNSGFAGIKLGSSVDSTSVTANTVADTQNGGNGILITADGASHTTMTHNDVFDNGGWGILQLANDGTSPTSSNVANQNDLTGNGSGGLSNADASSFDATNNWWGDPTGPSGAGPGSGDSVSGAGFSPWLRCSVESEPCGLYNAAPPSMTGTAAVGQTLHGARGTWLSALTITYTYQWQRCDSAGLNCVSIIPGGAALNYVVHNGDAGHTLVLLVTAADANTTITLAAGPSGVVPGLAPTNTNAPTVSGTAQVGQTLTGARGSWTGASSYAYQWLRCDSGGTNCAAVPAGGGHGLTYLVPSSIVGSTLELQVTATNTAGNTTATSAPTVVVPGFLPASTSAPLVTGTAAMGQTLTGTRGGWTGTGITFTYQWKRCDSGGNNCATVPAGGGHGLFYVVPSSAAGYTLVLAVTASNVAGSVTSTSLPTALVQGTGPASTSLPSVSGAAQVGQTLTGTRGGWTGSALTFTYQWMRCDSNGNNCTAVPSGGGHGLAYVAPSAVAGYTLELKVTASNAWGTVSATSLPTSVVGP